MTKQTCELARRSLLTINSAELPPSSSLLTMSVSDNPGRDKQLLAIGHQCSLSSCLLVDFLPFKCQHCNEQFCAEHFSVESHKCPKYDESKFNRVAPSCAYPS